MSELFSPDAALVSQAGPAQDPTSASAQESERTVILVEPDVTYAPDCAALLTEANYRVTTVKDVRELYFLRQTRLFAVAVLSDLVGQFALTAAAQCVRRQWPRARILILGQASTLLEDHLYDERVDQQCERGELVAALTRLNQSSSDRSRSEPPFAVASLPAPLPGKFTRAS